jgi:hypothetical protein
MKMYHNVSTDAKKGKKILKLVSISTYYISVTCVFLFPGGGRILILEEKCKHFV